jgi:hypothetical protein
MLYERADLVGQLAFADLKKQALINEKAKAANHDPDFSRRIRDGVIGFGTASSIALTSLPLPRGVGRGSSEPSSR